LASEKQGDAAADASLIWAEYQVARVHAAAKAAGGPPAKEGNCENAVKLGVSALQSWPPRFLLAERPVLQENAPM
jgi:hypothetical protein